MRRELLAVAERVFGETLGSRVVLREVAEFRAGRVARCSVEGTDRESVVVKSLESSGERGLATIHNELAALRVLGRLAPSLVPALLAAEPATGVLVLEDLGDRPSLASILLDGDLAAARHAAVTTASSLGALHASTIGHAAEFHELRSSLGEVDSSSDRVTLRGMHVGRQIGALPKFLSTHELPPLGEGALAELSAVVDELADPGDFLVLSNGDPCPDNERITPDGIKFFDFESAAFRHALSDAAHYWIPFPNCWCWRRLPEDVARAMAAAYRTSLATRCLAALDSERYYLSLARMTAGWLVWTLNRRLPVANSDELERRRTTVALDGFIASTAESEALPELTEWATAVRAALNDRWPRTKAAATYPAFGGPQFNTDTWR